MDSSVPVIQEVILRRLHDGEPAGYRRLFDARRDWRVLRTVLSRVPTPGTPPSAPTATTISASAVANHLAAVRAGARQVECTINGHPGERAGNASLEEIVMATRVRADLLAVHDRRSSRAKIYPVQSSCSPALTGEAVQGQQRRSSGRNAFAHEAGIHQDGMLKDRRTYEIMRPEKSAFRRPRWSLASTSGRHAVQRRCEQIGLALERH
jgi:2-isopropylmalate synthase